MQPGSYVDTLLYCLDGGNKPLDGLVMPHSKASYDERTPRSKELAKRALGIDV